MNILIELILFLRAITPTNADACYEDEFILFDDEDTHSFVCVPMDNVTYYWDSINNDWNWFISSTLTNPWEYESPVN